MNKVLINGKLTTSDKVNPKIHKWLGMFRPPLDQIKKYSNSATVYDIHYPEYDISKMRYLKGTHDIPQYINIKSRKS